MTTPEDISRNEHAPITRAEAPISGISLPAHLGIGTDLVDGIDYVVLIQVMFDTASGRKISPVLTWQRLQERGIRSTKNRAELVGRNTVYEAFSRIIESGYIERYEARNEKHPGRKGPVSYRVYDNPAWNPVWQAAQVGSDPLRVDTNAQVGTLPGTGDGLSHARPSNGKGADGNASRNQGSGVPGSGVPGSVKARVPAGRNASPVPGSPPHPLEEVTTSSPYPLSHGDGAKQHPSQTEGEEAGYAEEDLKAAADVLQVLPEPWTQGKLNAGRLAPKLLAVMAEQGWPGIHTVDRVVLTKQLTKNPHKVTNPYRLLASDRVPNLPRYGVVAGGLQSARGGAPEDMCPDHPQYRAGRRCIPCRMA